MFKRLCFAFITTVALVSTPCLANGPRTASTVYLEYLQVMRTANSLQQLFPYMASSLTGEIQGVLSSQTPEMQQKLELMTIAMLRTASVRPGTAPATPRVAESEGADSQHTTLMVTFPSHSLRVNMVLERGNWRVENEEVVDVGNTLGPLGR